MAEVPIRQQVLYFLLASGMPMTLLAGCMSQTMAYLDAEELDHSLLQEPRQPEMLAVVTDRLDRVESTASLPC